MASTDLIVVSCVLLWPQALNETKVKSREQHLIQLCPTSVKGEKGIQIKLSAKPNKRLTTTEFLSDFPLCKFTFERTHRALHALGHGVEKKRQREKTDE